MHLKTRAALVAGLSATALLAACGGGGGGQQGGGGGDATGDGAAGGEITVRGCQPQNPLIGGDTGESCGHDIVELFAATLFRYNPETGAPEKDIAESVESSDNQTFTVKIKPGYKFHDGTEVKAKNFVDAWNYTAYGPNAQYLAYFMEPIVGFADVSSEDPDSDGPKEAPKPKSETMSGLKVVDDHTFTIQTTEPVSNLPVRLGYTAFAPQPDAFFANPEEFAKKPVGAGPYQVESYDQGRQAVLTKFADFSGERGGNVDKITFRIYQDSEAAYNDLLAGNLDVIDEIPSSALVAKKYQSDLPERFEQKAYPAIQTVTFAPDKVSPDYANPKVRQAISMAIDRQKIIDDQFDGARQPADGWVAPGVEGYKAGTCGEFCTYNPEKAKQLLQEAGGFDGKLTISYNADSAHKAWVTATCNSIRGALGVDCVATPVTDFATFRDQIGAGKMKGMFRSGWIADYPHIENFLTPMYAKGASSNDNKYDNPEFDKALVEAGKAQGEQSLQKYQEAEQMLAQDMPAIPMWYYTATIGWSEKVENVQVNAANGRPDLLAVTVKQ
ncbi:peptide ABC transporter substrate-binding protein [Mobilicoccus caccae]|uniref:Peptide ABC transporter substrate-binding protein n=1 Tax=Mobilicoccus caccae TaxID=1859295 RepID=A0ABQ6IR67_9MICO|nr:ABC transporter substrate-binding protein [Mobilicoccus caccae]GMA39949.1 peptide ABC transporter substrate-binding protein [Mobilicoccus caccae]